MPTDPREDATGEAKARAEGRRDGWRAAVERAARIVDDGEPLDRLGMLPDEIDAKVDALLDSVVASIRALAEDAPDGPR